MIHRETALCLPLMHHLVQHRMLHLGPRMTVDMAAAQRDLRCSRGPAVQRELPQSSFHATRQSDRKLRQTAAEVLQVEPAVELFQPTDHPKVTGLGPLPSRSSLSRRCVGVNREIEKLSFGGPPECPRDTRVQEPNDRIQNLVGSEPIPPVNSEHPAVEAEHHRLVGVGEDPLHILETQRLQPLGETVLKQKTLPRGPAASLPCLQSP